MKNGTFDTFAIDRYFAKKVANQVPSHGNRSLMSLRKQPFAHFLKEASTIIVAACQLIAKSFAITFITQSSHMVIEFHILTRM